jgi:hypothetical protein
MAPTLNQLNGSYSTHTIQKKAPILHSTDTIHSSVAPTLHLKLIILWLPLVYRDSSFINGFYLQRQSLSRTCHCFHDPYRRFFFSNLHILLATTSSFVYFVHSEDTFLFPPQVYDPTCSTFLSLTKLKIRIFSQVVSSEK